MKKGNAGFTLVEVVIAISIAVLVSIASAAVIISTRTSSRNAEYKNNAVIYAANVTECFKASDNVSDFKEALEFSYLSKDVHFDIPSGSSWSGDDGQTIYLYLTETGNLYGVNAETTTVNTSWNDETSQKASYVLAINVAKCAGSRFVAATELNVVVYNRLSAMPTVSAETDGNAIYYFDKPYVKGVGD